MSPEEEHDKAIRRIKKAEENRSTELNLAGFQSLTRFPPELAGLTSLHMLNMSGCHQLSGDLSALAELKSLRSLSLTGCKQLSGDLRPLAALTSIQRLDLSWGDQLSGDLSPLAALTSLQSLDLCGCKQLSGDLSPLAALTSLQSLDLCGCKQLGGDLRPLAALTSLQSLDLYGCKQLGGDLRPLAALTSLQSLDLYGCRQLSGDLRPLAALTSLQRLDLSGCRQLSGDLTPLAALTSLQLLNLAGCDQLSGDLSPMGNLALESLIDDALLNEAETRVQKFIIRPNVCDYFRSFDGSSSIDPLFKYGLTRVTEPESFAVLQDWYLDTSGDTVDGNVCYIKKCAREDPGPTRFGGDTTFSNLFHTDWSARWLKNRKVLPLNAIWGMRRQYNRITRTGFRTPQAPVNDAIHEEALDLWLWLATELRPKTIYLCGSWARKESEFGEDHARELSVDKYFREAWSPRANEREIVSKARRTLVHTKIRSLPHPSNRRTPAWRTLEYRKYGVILPEV